MDYDISPIQAFTRYTYDELKAFQKSHFRKTRYLSTAYVIILALLLLLTLGLRFILGSDIPIFLIAFLVFSLLACVCSLLVFSMVFYTEKQYNEGSKLMRNGSHYVFRNHDFTESSEQADSVSENTMHYNILAKVREAKHAFYLYQNRIQAFVVIKAGIQCGTPDELRIILQSHLAAKQYEIEGGPNDRTKFYVIVPIAVFLLIMLMAVFIGFISG